jgi:peptidyl-prolyl cis-trans isomerase C
VIRSRLPSPGKTPYWQVSDEFDIVGASMKPIHLRTLFTLSGIFLVTGCRSAQEQPVAKVGNAVITVAEFKSRLHDTPAAYQQYAATPEGRRQFLNLLVREKVLLVESRKDGLQKDENYRKAVDQFKKKWDRDFKDYQESLLIEMVLSRLRAKELTLTDAEVRRYYDDHIADFTHPVEVQASHILVRTPQEAEIVLARLKKGESFEALARAVSMDPSTAAKGGKLAPFTRGSLLPEFEEVVFQLKNGQVSGVVKSPFGYHIIKKTGQKALPPRSFEGAKEEIQKRLQRDRFDQWVTKTQSTIGVHIDEQALASVSVAPPASAEPVSKGSAQ